MRFILPEPVDASAKPVRAPDLTSQSHAPPIQPAPALWRWLGIAATLVTFAFVAWIVWPDGGVTPGDSGATANPAVTGVDSLALEPRATEGTVALAGEDAEPAIERVTKPADPSERPEQSIDAEGDRRAPAGRLVTDDPAPARSADTTAPAATTPPPDTRAAGGRSGAAAPAPTRSPSRVPTRRTLPRVQTGLDLIAADEPVEARRVLSEVLASGSLDRDQQAGVRERIAELNEQLIFSPEVREDDPFSLAYTLQSNDALSRLPRKMGLQVDWRFLQLVNRIGDPKRIRLGQRLKLVTGPFHAVVHKTDFRMDVYVGDSAERVFVRSFPVGLGEFNSTPEGRFVVRPDSKLVNPEWRNPRTRERFAPDDPANPIGERWIGLMGDEPHLLGINGYGIHGTIEPDSIGRQASMGCVRMLPDDVAMVYGMLVEGSSTVEIRP